MDIMQLGAVGELVGGAAVIVTLAYLALQIRQSTAVAQASAERDLLQGVQAINDRVAQNAPMWRRGLHSFDTLSKEDQLIFSGLFNPLMNYLEQAIRMHDRGLLTADNLHLYGDICLSTIQEPGGREVWEHTKRLYFPMSRAYVQDRLDAGNDLPPPVSDLAPWWGPDEEGD